MPLKPETTFDNSTPLLKSNVHGYIDQGDSLTADKVNTVHAMSQAKLHHNQSPRRSTLAHWYGHASKAGVSPRIAALPAPSKVDVILMACGDVQMGMHSHGCCSPGFKVGSMGGLGHMVQQPGGHMAQLMAQRAL